VLATLRRLRRRYALPDPATLALVAQERRDRPTRAERELAALLNEVNGHALEGRFEREWVCGGRWIVDFYFPEVQLAIEVDGGYHRSTFQLGWDLFRAAQLEAAGVTLVRLNNQEVFGDRERLLAKLRRGWRSAVERSHPRGTRPSPRKWASSP
jgi:very-short-patch-repair endonuclease